MTAYLAWFDDSTKKDARTKVAEAVARYRERFGNPPAVVLMNADELVAIPGIATRTELYIRKHHYWLGEA